MRKLRLLLLAFAVLLSASGLQVRAHWCGEELTHIDWYAGGHHDCGCEHEGEELGGCCREEASRLRTSEGQEVCRTSVAARAKKVLKAKPLRLLLPYPSRVEMALAERTVQPLEDGEREEPDGVPLYVRLGNFRT